MNQLPHGGLGEAATRDRLVREGYSDITGQVRFDLDDGSWFVADFVARHPKGHLVAVEAKVNSGPITPNQAFGYPRLSGPGARVGTRKLMGPFGLKKGTSVRMAVEVDLWTCPVCS